MNVTEPAPQGAYLNNVSVRRISHPPYSIEGYSRAAVQTFWRIPELKLGFDLGAHPWDFMGTPTWFISHSHLDHIAALPVYIARRRMMKMEPPTIYLPEHTVDGVHRLLREFTRLDRGGMPCDLIGVKAGDEYELTRELVVTVHQTFHTIPSVGYIVWQRRKKLKQEYADCSGDQLRDLRLDGVEISREIRMPEVAYVGDSTPRGLDDNPDMYRARILISEMTFAAAGHRPEKIHKSGHMHLDDYVDRQHRFENELIVVGHFSTRYSKRQIERLVDKALPGRLEDRLYLWT